VPETVTRHHVLEVYGGTARWDNRALSLLPTVKADSTASSRTLSTNGRLLTSASVRASYSLDPSPYSLSPELVAMVRDVDEVVGALRYARGHDKSVTFRGAGTSLNGQAQGAGVIVDTSCGFSGVRVLDDGGRAWLGSGVRVGLANRHLACHGYRLGPDPGSAEIATIGGVIANNSGGMRCSVTWDAYSTVEAMTLVLANGIVIDTSDTNAERSLAAAAPELCRGLLAIRSHLLEAQDRAIRIRRKFQIRNTMGYRLCAFLDADTPLEIFRRLVIGSEGTLAFVADALFRTRPEPRVTAVGWLHFPTTASAVAVVSELVSAGARAVELMSARALVAATFRIPGVPEYWKNLSPGSAALLVEFGGTSASDLDEQERAVSDILACEDAIHHPRFTRDPQEIELFWRVRQQLFGDQGASANRATAIVEDVCVHREYLLECVNDLQSLLAEYGFPCEIVGHVSVGNIHFRLPVDLSRPRERARYENFMEGLAEIIVDRYDGSLKGEHGTGRRMACHVEREWGPEETALMWQVKRLADPHGVLNPDVLLSTDPQVHLRHLRTYASDLRTR
jgi:D-lactate dehydrogenase